MVHEVGEVRASRALQTTARKEWAPEWQAVKHFAVELDAREFEPTDEAAVVQVVLANACVDLHDPPRPSLASLEPPAPVRMLQGLVHTVACQAPAVFAAAAEAFGEAKDLLLARAKLALELQLWQA
eukprot:CAMPEP_0119416840 /NCGR_PEP_ID=MMETSP1335-20130426/14311_1 /TAXON_ID=259385 /ORGANISM="Chrysoculter rhomboideus, Strain RCC1486" /LENGTH=125 /DNA_ID=CAMNT_0007441985 /DNA_START=334 /DNA_END=709 /DNA_ORIENTATION=-